LIEVPCEKFNQFSFVGRECCNVFRVWLVGKFIRCDILFWHFLVGYTRRKITVSHEGRRAAENEPVSESFTTEPINDNRQVESVPSMRLLYYGGLEMTSWKEMLKIAFEKNKDDFDKMICTLSDNDLITEFNDGFGASEGKPFTAWGDKYVYFPVVYDGAEWVGSAPRNPCNEATSHWGGE